jgi:hypothetical protein
VVIADVTEDSGRYASRPRTLSAEQRTAILAARDGGQTLRQIAVDHRCSHVSVANIIQAEGET